MSAASSVEHTEASRSRRSPLLRVSVPLGMLILAAATSGCGGMLDPQSPRAERVVTLWWIMFAISAAVFALVFVVLLVGLWRAHRSSAPLRAETGGADRAFVFGGGIALPVVVMVILMVLTVWSGREITRAAEEDALTIEVIGHQWWWELRYPEAGFTTANEIHIPAGQSVQLQLMSEDVIHSFWVPELGGKIDLIPGRTNTLIIEASEAGTYRGQCAEFCGIEHAKMRVRVIAQDQADFDEWIATQQQPAEPVSPQDNEIRFAGQQAFLGSACVYCHTIRGTNASGALGPDLTHIASRQTLAAGVVPNTRGHLAGWILDPQSVKRGTQMPPTQLTPDQLDSLLAYLEGLE